MFIRLVVYLIISVSALLSVVYAGDKYIISGEVAFQYDGDIYICLCTKEEYQDLTQDFKLSRPQCRFIKMNEDIKKEGKVSFALNGIPKGTYGIIAFQDSNKNGKLDFSGKMYDEPYGSYRELPAWRSYFSWASIQFDLEKDLTGIVIQL